MNPFRLTTAMLLLTALTCSAAQERPNIVWLTSEDHGTEMGCYGDPLARTPNIDALAAQGMRYRLVWSTAPVCAPSRTAIISGLYPSSSGGIHMRSMVSLPPGMHLYPHYLRAAGYYTTNNDKEDYNLRAPADLWDESSKTAHWRNRAPGQPFFAIFNSMKSHESQIRQRPHAAVTDPARVRLPAYHPDTPEVRQDWAQYYDKVSEADADAGARLREIEAAGLAGDTIVFYYGDHGSGMPRSKRWPSHSGLHVPLVVYFPERWRHLAPADYTPGGESARFVDFVDLAPTLLSLGGTPPPAWMQGQAFAGPHVAPGRALLFGERGRMDERLDLVRSVTDGRYVYLRNYLPQVSQGQHVTYQFQTATTRIWRERFDQGKTDAAQSLFWQVPKAPEELYDLTTDPDEVRNLAALPEHRPVLERLRRALRAHLLAVRDLGFLPERELHARAGADTPYALGRDPARYPLEIILETAELASGLDPAATPALVNRAKHADSAVRYWAILGLRLRGADTVRAQHGALRRALADESADVRIVAAEALGHYGTAEQRSASLEVLRGLASPQKNGVFVALSALQAIEALGDRAAGLHPFVAGLDPRSPLPDPRFDGYVASLIESITGRHPVRQQTAPPAEAPYLKARPEALQRWDDLTFGLFLHWDMSSLLGVEISWHKQSRVDRPGEGPIPDEIYDNLYRSFNPQQFDARAFVQVAKDAGMRYIVFTAKHHGGFSMFDTKLTDYKITNTAFGRDVVAELAEATREAGLAFGFYYSQPDWHHPDFIRKDFDAYRAFLFGQLRELCTNYGRIDMIFFDGLSYGEKEFHSRELFKMIRELQPDVVINDRCGLPADYATPEQVVGAFRNDRPWESCMTLGTSWSWKTGDTFKSAAECIRILVSTVGGDGNLLLNVGPMPTGMIEPRQAAILKQVGDWLRLNGESVYALEGGPYKPAGWGACTSKGRTLYLHVLSWFDVPEKFPPLPVRIERAERLDGRPVAFTQDADGVRFDVPEQDRDPFNTVIKLTLAEDAKTIAPILVATRSLARFGRVTASHATDTAATLVDDDPQTEWIPGVRQCWVEIDLGSDRRFNRVDIREEGHEWEERTKDFELLYRTGDADWVRLDRGTKIGHTYSKIFPAVTGRFVRLVVKDSGTLPFFSEFQVYDRP